MIRWFLYLKQWQRLAIALPATAGMFALIWYLNGKRQEKEPTFEDHARTWELPITVSWDDDYWGENYDESFAESIKFWNDAAGCKIFTTAAWPEGQVTLRSSDGEPCGEFDPEGRIVEPDEAAAAWYCPGDTADILIAAPGDVRDLYRISAHELGHVLGLAHDAPGTGIMAKKDAVIRATDKDAAALGEKYCAE